MPETAVKPFDRATAEELRVSIRETVKNIVGNNITLDSISATYTPTDIKFTIKISQPDSSGMSTAERDFIHLAPLYGIAADALGKSIVIRRKEFCIIGLLPRRYKKPISLRNVETGKLFICPAETVKRFLSAGHKEK